MPCIARTPTDRTTRQDADLDTGTGLVVDPLSFPRHRVPIGARCRFPAPRMSRP